MSWYDFRPQTSESELSGLIALLEFQKQFGGRWNSPSLFAAGDHNAWKALPAPPGYLVPDIELWSGLVKAKIPEAPALPRRR